MVGVRIDIDTVRDAKMLPATLELLEKYGVRASFFVTTGVDETYRNFRHYLNPFRLISTRALQRYGSDVFSGLLRKGMVQDFKGLETILEGGHELGLHGYNHFRWMNHINGRSREEISDWISRGCELFEGAFGFYPRCFAAPGFASTPDFLEALESFGFKYSSDFKGSEPFYPGKNGRKFKTKQIPVSLALGEFDGHNALRLLKEQIESGYSVFYFHPSYEPVFQRGSTERALCLVSDMAEPLGEIVK